MAVLLSSLYNPQPATALPFTLGNIDIQDQNAREDTGLQKQQNTVQFGRNLTNLVNGYSAKGTVRGGMAGVAGDQLRQDFDYGQADLGRLLARQLAALQRNRVLATAGVMV